MSTKVLQSAAKEVAFLTSDKVETQRALRAITESSNAWAVRLVTKSETKVQGLTLFSAVITYTAKGANKNDITRRVSKIPAEFVYVSPANAEITKLR